MRENSAVLGQFWTKAVLGGIQAVRDVVLPELSIAMLGIQAVLLLLAAYGMGHIGTTNTFAPPRYGRKVSTAFHLRAPAFTYL